MARSCLCEPLLRRAADDMGFHALPDYVQLIWFRLLASANSAVVPGILRFFPSVSVGVSRLLTQPETQVETALQTLQQLGLIELDPGGAEVALPGARAAAGRAEAARINGKGGGRPRKGETKEEANLRRQGHLPLPIQGGADGNPKTQQEPIMDSSRASSSSSSDSIKGKEEGISNPPRATRPAWSVLGEELAEVALFDKARGFHDHRLIQAWLAEGATPEMIREVVTTVASRPAYVAKQASSKRAISWTYFNPMMRDAIEGNGPAQPGTPATPPKPSALTDEDRRLIQLWTDRGQSFDLPPHLLAALRTAAA